MSSQRQPVRPKQIIVDYLTQRKRVIDARIAEYEALRARPGFEVVAGQLKHWRAVSSWLRGTIAQVRQGLAKPESARPPGNADTGANARGRRRVPSDAAD